MLKNIQVGNLLPHPGAANHADAELLCKLRCHIELSGNYEPLTVRPHPHLDGKYEVLNGRARLHVLRALTYDVVHCVVWEIGDSAAALCLATLNRLGGSDVPERRAVLLDTLLQNNRAEDLSDLLPDTQRQLAQLEQIVRVDLDVAPPLRKERGGTAESPVVLSFMVPEQDAKRINLALDLILDSWDAPATRTQALHELARHYLNSCEPC
jgi:ParB-like chromosome segregation protein Spo0J